MFEIMILITFSASVLAGEGIFEKESVVGISLNQQYIIKMLTHNNKGLSMCY